MKQFINVQGTQLNQPSEIEVNVDTVYIRSNIQRIDTVDFKGWNYDEIQYHVREYIELISNVNSNLNKTQLEQDSLIMQLILGGA